MIFAKAVSETGQIESNIYNETLYCPGVVYSITGSKLLNHITISKIPKEITGLH